MIIETGTEEKSIHYQIEKGISQTTTYFHFNNYKGLFKEIFKKMELLKRNMKELKISQLEKVKTLN